MKKFLSIMLSVLLVLSVAVTVAGCGGGDDSQISVLRVGMECDYAPFNWTQTTNENGAVAISGTSEYANGYDVMVAKEIAEELNLELEIYKIAWDGLVAALQARTIDVIIAGMSPTDERKESIDFSSAYYTSNLVVVVKAGAAIASATQLSDINIAGLTIAAQQGTFHENALEQLTNVTRQSVIDFTTMISQLSAGTIDGYIAEKPGAIANCNANDAFTYINLTNNTTGFATTASDVEIAAGVRKGSTLASRITTVLSGINNAERETMMSTAISNQPTL